MSKARFLDLMGEILAATVAIYVILCLFGFIGGLFVFWTETDCKPYTYFFKYNLGARMACELTVKHAEGL